MNNLMNFQDGVTPTATVRVRMISSDYYNIRITVLAGSPDIKGNTDTKQLVSHYNFASASEMMEWLTELSIISADLVQVTRK
jgi:hypothetical protein